MISQNDNRRLCDLILWLFAGCVLVILLTSCSPYAVGSANLQTHTPTPSATATHLSLRKDNSTPTPRPSCVIVTGYERGTVNFRQGPGTGAAVIGILHEGQAVTVLQRGAWLKVETGQHVTGWVYGRYCR